MKPYYQDDSVTIYNNDCIEIMKEIDANSIDAIVTDPPYELGFMGKDWDKSGIANSVELWQQALRVLKPGGYVLSFGGSRTYHRMACAIEDAGFEIRDMVEWLYGCLSEDTEILTINGWEHYHKDITNNPVLCYNVDKDNFEFHKPIKKFLYENKHTAYRIKSDKTDQIVSRNHRVLIEREGKMVFETAEQLARQPEATIPILESLSDLPRNIYDIYKGTSNQEQGLSELYQEENGKVEQREIQASRKYMSLLWEKFQTFKWTNLRNSQILLTQLSSKSSISKTFSKIFLFRQSRLDRKKHGKLFKENDWQEQSCLEGWSNLFQQAWKLSIYKIRQVSRRIFSYGTQRWLRYGASFNNGSISWQGFNQNRSSSSYKSQFTRQSFKEFNALFNKQGTQNIRRTRATIKPIKYKGKVWCVKVPTGAFVARRNGKIFITGNSGFPKSHNIGKAVDKLQGNERKEISRGGKCGVFAHSGSGKKQNIDDYEAVITKGNSKWEGYGTALKPAHEPICMARKPLSEKTVAKNVLKWGTGGINIDECRVEANDDKIQAQHSSTGKGFTGNKDYEFHREYQTQGRFPANLLHDGSDEVVGLFPDSGKSSGGQSGVKKSGLTYSANWDEKQNSKGCGFGDKGSAARFFYCAKASKSERNMGCEGLEEKDTGVGALRDGGRKNTKKAKNNHPTIKPLKLMEYLIKLVTTKNAIVLDPFTGSGTTLIACKSLGRKGIGIEMSKEYCDIAVKRVGERLGQEVLF